MNHELDKSKIKGNTFEVIELAHPYFRRLKRILISIIRKCKQMS